VWRGKLLPALCSASFYVNAEARTNGFFILKRYLNCPSYDFFFATTCGTDSGALWSKLRGRPIPGSGCSVVLPNRVESLLESFAENRDFHGALIALLRVGGKIGSAFVRSTRRHSAGFRVAPCRDWEKLFALTKTNGNPDRITNERSAKFLEWRYGRESAGARKEIYTFCDRQGHEGWFAIAFGRLGERKPFPASEVLDFVWPANAMPFCELVSIFVAATSETSDALYIRQRPGMQFRGLRQFGIRLNLPTPRCYVAAAKGQPTPDPALFDFVAADGDSAA
jgi:hypothetical protein